MSYWADTAPVAPADPAARASAPSDPAAQSGAPVLGLPPHLGLPALCGAGAGAQEADSTPDAGASAAGPAESETEGQANADGEQASTHHTERVVGHRHDQSLGAGLRLGLHRGGAGLVHQDDRRL